MQRTHRKALTLRLTEGNWFSQDTQEVKESHRGHLFKFPLLVLLPHRLLVLQLGPLEVYGPVLGVGVGA